MAVDPVLVPMRFVTGVTPNVVPVKIVTTHEAGVVDFRRVALPTLGVPVREVTTETPHVKIREYADAAYILSLTPAAWYRYGLGITSSGGLVSQWDDQSGNDNHLVQATGTNQPSHEADGSILFDGVDNFMQAVAFTLDQPFTVYLLGRQVTWTATDRILDGNTQDTAEILQTSAGASPQIRQFAGSQGSDNSDWTVNAYAVLSAVFNGASSVLQINNNTAVTSDVGAQNADGFTLGAIGTGSANWSNIQVKEVLIYSAAHDATVRANVARYLAAVGGLVL